MSRRARESRREEVEATATSPSVEPKVEIVEESVGSQRVEMVEFKYEETVVDVKLARRLYPGLTGVITNATISYFGNLGVKGVVVEIQGDDGQTYMETLWVPQRGVVGSNSKLGAFLVALGKNIKEWVGKRIRIAEWSPGNRQVEVLG